MKKLLVLLFCFVLNGAISTKVSAQIHPDLVIGAVTFPQADSLGNTANLSFGLMNIGTDSFTYADHKFTFYLFEDSFTNAVPGFALVPTLILPFSNGTSGHMNAGDSLSFTIPITLNNPPFKAAGNNEIVIWPKTAPGEQDSLNNFYKITFFLYDIAAYIPNTPDVAKAFHIYPSPATSDASIYMNSALLKNTAQLRIVNALGQTVYTETLQPNVSNLARNAADLHLQAGGVYMIYLQCGREFMVQRLVISK